MKTKTKERDERLYLLYISDIEAMNTILPTGVYIIRDQTHIIMSAEDFEEFEELILDYATYEIEKVIFLEG